MTAQSRNQGKARIPALDGLRAVAVFGVLFNHLAPTYAVGGFLGVDLFFCLSGYLITSILLDEFGITGRISFSHFYLRRIVRLTPALALLIIAASGAVLVTRGKIFHWQEVLYAGSYTMNWARAFGWGDSLILGHTWSLGIEEQFYLVWPPILALALWRCPKYTTLLTALLTIVSMAIGIILFATGSTAGRIYNGFDTRSQELLIGCMLAFVPLASRSGVLLARFWFVALVGLAAAIYFGSFAFFSFGGYAIVSVFNAWLILAIQNRCALATPLENKVVVYFGRISYGLYLWHYFYLGVAEVAGLRSIPRDAAVVLATLVTASVSYHFVEAPLLRATQGHFAASSRITRAAGAPI